MQYSVSLSIMALSDTHQCWSGRRTLVAWRLPLCWASQGLSFSILNWTCHQHWCFQHSVPPNKKLLCVNPIPFRILSWLGQSYPSQQRRGWATRSSRSTSLATRPCQVSLANPHTSTIYWGIRSPAWIKLAFQPSLPTEDGLLDTSIQPFSISINVKLLLYHEDKH